MAFQTCAMIGIFCKTLFPSQVIGLEYMYLYQHVYVMSVHVITSYHYNIMVSRLFLLMPTWEAACVGGYVSFYANIPQEFV